MGNWVFRYQDMTWDRECFFLCYRRVKMENRNLSSFDCQRSYGLQNETCLRQEVWSCKRPSQRVTVPSVYSKLDAIIWELFFVSFLHSLAPKLETIITPVKRQRLMSQCITCRMVYVRERASLLEWKTGAELRTIGIRSHDNRQIALKKETGQPSESVPRARKNSSINTHITNT